MKPPLLAELLRNTSAVAERAVRLRQLLPYTNVSVMASKQPELLLQVTVTSIINDMLANGCYMHAADIR